MATDNLAGEAMRELELLIGEATRELEQAIADAAKLGTKEERALVATKLRKLSLLYKPGSRSNVVCLETADRVERGE